MSQYQCGGPSSQIPYPSWPWWAVAPPTSEWDACPSRTAALLSTKGDAPKGGHGVLPGVTPGCPPERGWLNTRSEPVRNSSPPDGKLPSDLHVLGLPLAFILSQDQTLHCIIVVLSCFPVRAPL